MSAECEIVVQDGLEADEALLARIENWLAEVVESLAPDAASFTARLADDGEVRGVNADLRGRDRPTDVLSFEGGETPEGLHLGDVLISLETARRQGVQLGHSLEREVKELLLHGILHCLGHDHETDAGEMAGLELELRDKWIDHD